MNIRHFTTVRKDLGFSHFELAWLENALRKSDRIEGETFGKKQNALFLAAKQGNADMCEHLLRIGYNVNSKDMYGQTPLYSAIQSKSVECCSLLIEKGADINHQDFNCNTPLIKALSIDDLDVMKLLLENGAEPNKQNKDGSPLYIAYCEANIKAAKLLRDYGAVSFSDFEDKGRS